MFYRLLINQQEELTSIPDTGMGYQLIQARFAGEYLWWSLNRFQ